MKILILLPLFFIASCYMFEDDELMGPEPGQSYGLVNLTNYLIDIEFYPSSYLNLTLPLDDTTSFGYLSELLYSRSTNENFYFNDYPQDSVVITFNNSLQTTLIHLPNGENRSVLLENHWNKDISIMVSHDRVMYSYHFTEEDYLQALDE